MIGQTISHFKILEKLGEGGMGVVYKAHDTTLDRFVALKFLPHDLTPSQGDKDRFYQEAKAASALNHTNITTIYEIRESGDRVYLAMEFVEGKTLKKLIEEGPLPVQTVLGIGIQACEGLAAAHEKGIVHRDTKSDNIMVTPKGHVKITDFGLAKIMGASRLTRTGSTVGTAAYMSPEQARGEDVDHRSDIFSFGVVLYEALAGKLPFRGEHIAAVMYSLINEAPAPLTRLNNQISPELEKIVFKAMAKEREERYQHAAELLADLRQEAGIAPSSAEGHRPTERGSAATGPAAGRPMLKYLIPLGALALTAILIAVFNPFNLRLNTPQGSAVPAPEKKSIAVLPFVNLSPEKENEYIGDGITDETITTLSQIPALRVTPLTTVMALRGSQKSMDEIARDLHVAYVMEGSVRKDGEQIRIGAKLVDVGQEKTLWAKTFDKGFAGIFDIQRQVAAEVASVLEIQLDASAHFGRRYQPSAPAYALYLRGMFLRRKFSLAGLREAMGQFEAAIAADPKFSDAYVQLAGVYASVIDLSYSTDPLYLKRADSLLSVAKTLEPDFSPYNVIVGFVADLRGDKRTAELSYRIGIERDSSIWYSHSLLGWLLLEQGRNAEALDAFDGALRADPTVFTPLAGKAIALEALGRTEEALRHIDNALTLEPANSLVLNTKAGVLMQQKDYTKAVEILRKSLAADSAKGPTHLYLAEALALRGDKRECWKEWRLAHAAPDRNPSEAYALAILYAADARRDSACRWLGRAADLGFSQDELISHDARLAPLRGEPCVETVIGRARENRERWITSATSK